jgi:NodT family efflux transporter outer membrane factor (OMF) lipoprotein
MSREDQVRNIIETPSIELSVVSSLGGDFFGTGAWPEKMWWTQYQSDELNLLIAKALEQNPSIQAVRERIEFARAQAVIARSQLLPLVYFNASDQLQYLSENGLYRALNPKIALGNQQIDFSLSFSYEFDFWGKYRNLYEAALGREKAARAETAQVELIVSTSLAQVFFALRTNLVRRDYYEQLWGIRKRYFDLQTKMMKNALYSKLVPLLSEEAVFAAKQRVYEVEQEIAVNRHTINVLAGRGPDERIELNERLVALPEMLAIPFEISSELLSRRPDLMAQIWRMDALAREVGAAKADFWPNVNILGLVGLESGSWSKLFEWVSRTIGVLPGLSLPVYTAGAIGANVDAKRALFDEEVYHYNDLILKSFQQVADLLAMGKAVYGEKEKQGQIVANAVARYRLTRSRQNSGIDSALTSYRIEEEAIEKKIEDVELLYQQYLVSVSLIRALGGGYGAP